MVRTLPELAARAVPRYTSYPTSAEFRDDVGAYEQAAALATISRRDDVSLYLHIPYCQEICWYCGCTTGAVGRPERLATYVDALLGEIDAVAARMAGRVTAIHFGGGSPNALAATDMTRLVAALRDRFTVAQGAEIAVELDPRTLDADYCALLGSLGVTRASLGVQTFAAAIQRRINRVQPYWTVAEAVRDLRYAGVRRINFDLLYGLPGQGVEDVAATIAAALRLHPERIAMFGYAHMPRLLPRQRMIDAAELPGIEARLAQSRIARTMLTTAGYRAIGFDHFAVPSDSLALAAADGRLHRNFQGFTDEAVRAVIGLGASAISQYDGLLIQNEKHVGCYRGRVKSGLAGVRGVVRSPETRLRGAVIERFLCDGRVDVAAIARSMAMAPDPLLPALDALAELVEAGVVVVDGWCVALAPSAWPYARIAAAAFDSYRTAGDQRFSRAV